VTHEFETEWSVPQERAHALACRAEDCDCHRRGAATSRMGQERSALADEQGELPPEAMIG
jgi:hypothetical protein